MKKTNLFNKKAIIIFPIIIVLVLTSFGTLGFMGSGKNRDVQEQINTENIEDLVDNETAQRIIDIHKNPEKHNEKVVTLEVQFFEFEDGRSVGIEYVFEGGDSLLFDIPADFGNIELPEGIQNFDWVKVTGKIKLVDETHEEHSHSIPMIYVDFIETLQ